jgi:hypothetical protein
VPILLQKPLQKHIWKRPTRRIAPIIIFQPIQTGLGAGVPLSGATQVRISGLPLLQFPIPEQQFVVSVHADPSGTIVFPAMQRAGAAHGVTEGAELVLSAGVGAADRVAKGAVLVLGTCVLFGGGMPVRAKVRPLVIPSCYTWYLSIHFGEGMLAGAILGLARITS